MKQNIFIKCIDGIVKEAYAGGDKPVYDWNTAIDRFDAKYHITDALKGDSAEVMRQRSEFLSFVKNRKFDRDGKEIKEPKGAPDTYTVNGEEIKITGDMVD